MLSQHHHLVLRNLEMKVESLAYTSLNKYHIKICKQD